MSFSLTILGSSSALPKPDRFTTAHVLNAHERFFLIDCGEGTQLQLRRFRIQFSRIHHIFISHLHGDHFFGLPGLISSFNLMGRKRTLYIYGPPELELILRNLHQVMDEKLNYPLVFKSLNPTVSELILDTPKLSVNTIPLDHKKPSLGFLFREKPEDRKIRKEFIEELGLSIKEILQLKKGNDVVRENGQLLEVSKLTKVAKDPRSYAFVSDTRYSEKIVQQIHNVDLLYHEATYLDEMKARAKVTGHSTATEAAKIARMAGVKQLVIGHFSARYKDTNPLLQEAKSIFINTILAEDGLSIDVNN